jgi:hypothetical protein
MAGLARTESVKLIANWFNTVSAALMTVGVFTPLAVTFYGIGDPPRNSNLQNGLPIICIGGSWLLHWVGQWFIRKLDGPDDAQ